MRPTHVTGPSSAIVRRDRARRTPAGTTRENTMFRRFTLGAATAVALMAAMPAYAVTELQWWHAMTGGNNDVIVKLANDFNASHSDYKVVPTYKGGYADTMNAGIAAFR